MRSKIDIQSDIDAFDIKGQNQISNELLLDLRDLMTIIRHKIK